MSVRKRGPAAEIAAVVDKFSRYGLKSRTPR
jgi:hypothetical protein